MKRKQILKVSVDAVMLVLFFLQMAYHLFENSQHEWIGVGLILLFILHQILNWKWYRGLLKGKYSGARILMTTINLLLLVSMIGIMVSGMMLSREVFDFLNLRAGMLGRRLHMVSTAWSYLLMAAHLGVHSGMILGLVKKMIHLKSKWSGMIGRIVVLLISMYGVYAFVTRQLADRMFLLMEYAFFDYEEPAVFFFGDYLCILILFAAGTYYLSKQLRKERSESK